MIKKVFFIINIVLITAGIYFAVNLVYALAGAALEDMVPAASMQKPETPAENENTGRRFAHYSAVAERNIFQVKKNNEDAAPADVDLESLKRTDLDLRLLGTISGLGKNSFAVIEQTKAHEQDLYQAGDTVAGARIKLILRKKVVLTINGNDEVLEIPEENAALRRPSARDSRYHSGRSGESSGPTTQVTISQKKVQNAFSNVNDLMKKVRVRPHFTKEGRPDGLKLENVASDSIFREMGLQDNDIIVGVNNKRIHTVDDCMRVYRNLSEASQVSLKVKRGGTIRRINYSVR